MNETRPDGAARDSVERQINEWRSYLRKSRSISDRDAAELEDHLREQMASLGEEGLSLDEAFLVAVKRMGAIDALTREFAREHSDRLWKQLVLSGGGWESGTEAPSDHGTRKLWVALGLAAAAAVAMKIPALFGINFQGEKDGADFDTAFYLLNMSFFTLPFIAAYFAWERPLARAGRLFLVAVLALAAAVVNAFPFAPEPGRGNDVAHTHILTGLHLPIALWLAVGIAYVGGRWRGSERRMDFVRFTGELFIYYVLIALGGGLLIGVSFVLFRAIGLDIESQVGNWVLPCGIAGATVVATWLVEAKQSVIENMAPVLTRVFAPLFAVLLFVFLATMGLTGRGINVEREILIGFDLLLVVVFGLLLYSISARDPMAPPGFFDWIQLTLVVTALVVDVLALWAIGTRISEFGFTPNRVAALGENVVLLANLTGSAVLYARFVRGRVAFSRLAEWQTSYLYVLAAWAAVVAFFFPPIFGFR
jgi:hypothetical protein